jgi:NTE family protein
MFKKKNPPPQSTELTTKDFLNFGKVPKYLKILERKRGQYAVSDVWSDDPQNPGKKLYFVDLVQQGGGVLGVALVGYTYALEAAGIRFLSLAGTSAGAINTVMIAAMGTPKEAKSEKVLDALRRVPFDHFVDGGKRVTGPLQNIIDGKGSKLFNIISLLFQNGWRLHKQKALNSGTNFEEWLEYHLEQNGIRNTADLLRKMRTLPDDIHGIKPIEDNPEIELAIVAADITTQTKVIFPRMSDLYRRGGNDVSPKDMVRSSMAIPVFFKPVEFDVANHDDDYQTRENWEQKARYIGPIPEKVYMVDGGIMSNFPIDLFHSKDKTPTRPTFGIRLGESRTKANKISSLGSILASSFDGARNLRDSEFLATHEDFAHLVKSIDVEDHNWLNFSMTDKQKLELFELGVEAACEFLEGDAINEAFDWERYKTLRRRMLYSTTSDSTDSLWTRDDAIWKLGLSKHLDPQKVSKNGLVDNPGRLDELVAWKQDFRENLEMIETEINITNKRPKILWIDQDPANDFFELSILRALKIDSVTSISSEDALKKIAEQKDFLAIVSDAHRNGDHLEGLIFANRLKRIGGIHAYASTLPIMMHSTTLSTMRIEDNDLVKIDDTSAMSCDPKLLEQQIRDFIKQNYSPNIQGNYLKASDLTIALVGVIAAQLRKKKQVVDPSRNGGAAKNGAFPYKKTQLPQAEDAVSTPPEA